MEKFEKLTQEMNWLYRRNCLDEIDVQNRYALLEEIFSVLKIYYPDCQLFIYGSTLNGYGTIESDLDIIFLPFPDYNNDNCVKTVGDGKKIKEVPSIADVNTGKVPKEDLLEMDVSSQLRFVRKIMRKIMRKKKLCQKVMFIDARCPILRFDSIQLNLSCDMSCGSSLVIHNTALLRFFNQLDDRVRPLVMTLRHWAKCLSIIQSGILSSYGFTLLVIFFLQNTDPPILPSVKQLIRDSGFSLIVDGWDVSFSSDLLRIGKSKNTKSCGELLGDFFLFYWKFDFTKNIVSTHIGSSLLFKHLENVTDERLKEFAISALSIQDPFKLSHNVGRNVHPKSYYFFKQALFIALKILDRTHNFALYDNINLLFNKNEYKHLIKKVFSPSATDQSFVFEVCFNQGRDTTVEEGENSRYAWYADACQALLDILLYGLLFDCEVIEKSIMTFGLASKQAGTEINNEFLMSIQCAVYNRTYVGRSQVKKVPAVDCDSQQFSNDTVRNEFVISNYLIKQNPLLSSPEPFFWFYCDCYRGTFDQLVIVLTPLTHYLDFKSLFNFLSQFLPKYISKMLSENVYSVPGSSEKNGDGIIKAEC